MCSTRLGTSIALLLLGACASPPVPPAEQPSVPSSVPIAVSPPGSSPAIVREPAPSSEPDAGVEVPTSCAIEGANPCLPDPAFASRLCERRQPGVALAMFATGTPWTRVYIRGRSVTAWDTSGAATEKMSLEFDEEVILLRKRSAPSSSIVVSGAGDSYDVIRWDGACVTLDAEEMTHYFPPVPKAPDVPWKQYDDGVQEALLADRAVAAAYQARRKECRGASMGDVSAACAKANHALSRAVVRFLRAGGKVPVPARLP